jgi:hypothetical protein
MSVRMKCGRNDVMRISMNLWRHRMMATVLCKFCFLRKNLQSSDVRPQQEARKIDPNS